MTVLSMITNMITIGCLGLNIIFQILDLILDMEIEKSKDIKRRSAIYHGLHIVMLVFMMGVVIGRPMKTDIPNLTDVDCEVIYENGTLNITYLEGTEEKSLSVNSYDVTYKPDNIENTKITIADEEIIIKVPNK